MFARRLLLCVTLTATAALFIACSGAGKGTRDTAKSEPATAGKPNEAKSAAPSSPKLTMAKYKAVEDGMAYYDVCKVIGSEGEEMSRNKIGDVTTVLYMWKGDFGANMNVTFQNDKVVSKAQFGLK